MYDAYRDAGDKIIDTANIYTDGTSERILGELLDGHRDEVVLSTKYTKPSRQGPQCIRQPPEKHDARA